MTHVAVVAHARKGPRDGLTRLREALEREGVHDPLWYEVPKSRKAPAKARKAIAAGSDLVIVWGGDGTVQRCVDVLAGSHAALAIIPVGTANLLASSLGVPTDIDEAVRTAVRGARRRLDTGSVNGEHFSVMAGAGFDARMVGEADRAMKDRLGRVAYVWTGARNLGRSPVKVNVKVDGKSFFKGRTSCLLVGNVGEIFGGLKAFPDASPQDGRLDVGIVTASNTVQWTRVLGRVAAGRAPRSKFVRSTKARKIDVRFAKPMPYELDGGARDTAKSLRIRVHPRSVEICVPEPEREPSETR